jgi:hypothetical protein
MTSFVKMHFPKAKYWMWNYCVFLGPYYDPIAEKKYDLGLYFGPDGTSFAIVYGDDPGDYLSGDIKLHSDSHVCGETLRRAKECQLI